VNKILNALYRKLGWIPPLSALKHMSLLEESPNPHVTSDLEWLALMKMPSLSPLLPLPNDFWKWLRCPNTSV